MPLSAPQPPSDVRQRVDNLRKARERIYATESEQSSLLHYHLLFTICVLVFPLVIPPHSTFKLGLMFSSITWSTWIFSLLFRIQGAFFYMHRKLDDDGAFYDWYEERRRVLGKCWWIIYYLMAISRATTYGRLFYILVRVTTTRFDITIPNVTEEVAVGGMLLVVMGIQVSVEWMFSGSLKALLDAEQGIII